MCSLREEVTPNIVNPQLGDVDPTSIFVSYFEFAFDGLGSGLFLFFDDYVLLFVDDLDVDTSLDL